MRMTHLRRSILETLKFPDDRRTLQDQGWPPYSAVDVQRILDLPDLSNVSRTLRQMEAAGLVVSETADRPISCALKRVRDANRALRVYWNAETVEEDKAALKDHLDAQSTPEEVAENVMNLLYPERRGHAELTSRT